MTEKQESSKENGNYYETSANNENETAESIGLQKER